MKIVLLFSGGVDSTVLLYQLLKDRREVIALSVDYGQRHARELTAARLIASRVGVRHVVADLSGLKPIFGVRNSQTGDLAPPEAHQEDLAQKQTVVPNRNMVMLSVAAALAITERAGHVAYACHAGDAAIYPDCRKEFVVALEEALSLADDWPVSLLTPFIGWSKAKIVERGRLLGVPFGQTWTCYVGGDSPCGKCGACRERAEAGA